MRSPFIDKAFNGPSPDWDARVRRGRAARDLDDLPRQLGIADVRRRGWNRKGPIRAYHFAERWLRAQVGRRWDAVWSDICAQADARTAAGSDLRDLFLGRVDLDTHRAEDGRLKVWSAYGGYRDASGLAVDPEGVLRLVVPPARPRAERPVERIRVGADRELRLIEGLWYEVRFAALPPVTTERVDFSDGSFRVVARDPGAFDLLEGRQVRRREGWRDTGRASRTDRERETYAAEKRALSGEALRRRGLANDPDAKAPRFRRRRGERH